MPGRPAWLDFGWLLALLALLGTAYLAVSDEPLSRDWLLALFALLALSRLLP